MQSYHNDALRLDYAYPKTYIDATAIVAPAFEASINGNAAVASTAKCITLPFSRMAADGGQANIIILLRAEAACLKKKFNAQSVAELAAGEAQGIAASGAKTNFGKAVNFEIDHHPASRLQGSFTLPTGQTMQSMVVCALDEPDIVCWQFLSSTTAGLATMSGFPVTFAGGQPTSLNANETSPTK